MVTGEPASRLAIKNYALPGGGSLDEAAGMTNDRVHDHCERIYRHPVAVRVYHWVQALCFVLLLMSGLQIFNAYPRLHWGATGYAGMPAIFEIAGSGTLQDRRSWIDVGSQRLYTTGLLGVPHELPFEGVVNVAFPPVMILPSRPGALGYGRGWHFLAAWIFAFNLGWYLTYAVCSGRVCRELWPTERQMRWRAALRDLWQHMLLRRETGKEARHYNLLQKLSYLTVLFILLPTQILSGMTMSNTALAVFPWLLTIFEGRQSARTVHFVIAICLACFLLVHIFQVFVAGFVSEMRSMITGYFEVPKAKHHDQ